MLSSPQFLQQMSSVMSNPAVLDQIIASNPQLAGMGPQVRQVFQSEHFRQMMYVALPRALLSSNTFTDTHAQLEPRDTPHDAPDVLHDARRRRRPRRWPRRISRAWPPFHRAPGLATTHVPDCELGAALQPVLPSSPPSCRQHADFARRHRRECGHGCRYVRSGNDAADARCDGRCRCRCRRRRRRRCRRGSPRSFQHVRWVGRTGCTRWSARNACSAGGQSASGRAVPGATAGA